MDGRGGPESDSTGELLRRKKMVGYRVTFERTNRETMPGKVRNRLQKCIRVGVGGVGWWWCLGVNVTGSKVQHGPMLKK
jgi:hypothetical protein